MAWYKTGTISVTAGSTTVTGTGTSWVAGAGIGEALYAPDGRIYEIASIASNTSITLASNYLGVTASNQSYVIIPSQSYIRDLASDAASLISQYASIVSGAGAGKFTDGTLATPGIAFTADEDTGIRRVGTNSLALVAAGVDRLSISTSGVNVGTFSNNPVFSSGTANGVTYLNGSKVLTSGSALTFDGTKLEVGVTSSGTSTEALRVSNQGLGANTQSLINFTSTATSYATIAGGYGASAPQMTFNLPSATAGNYVWQITSSEQMRLTSTGLGIGTNSPAQKLHVNGNIQNAANQWIGNSAGASYLADDGVVGGSIRNGGSFFITTGGAERVRIDASGNLGIGTSLPTARLSVQGPYTASDPTTGSVPAAKINHGGALSWWFGGKAYEYVWSQGIQDDGTNNLKNMVLQPLGGSVGIGGSPSSRLHVENGGYGTSFIASAVSETASQVNIGIGVLTVGRPFVGTNTSSNPLEIGTRANTETVFVTNGSERMRIDTSGNLGIGTSSPIARLHVDRDGPRTLSLSPVNRTAGSASYILMGNSDSNGVAGPSMIVAANRALQFGVGNSFNSDTGGTFTEYMRLDDSGNFGIGTSSPQTKLHVYGTGDQQIRVSTITSGSPKIQLNAEGVNGGGITYDRATSLLQFENGGTTSLYLTTAGNLGIGTTSPGSKLEIRNDVTATTSLNPTAIKLFNNLDGGSGIEFSNGVAGKSKISFGVEASGSGTDDTYLGFSTCLNAGALTERMRLSASGNLGLGVTPSAWSTLKGFDIGSGGAALSSSGNAAYLSANAYYNGSSWTYKGNAFASLLTLEGGSHKWFTAPSGTAGNAISFTQAMTLDVGGNLGVGATSPTGKIHASASDSSSAVGSSTASINITNQYTSAFGKSSDLMFSVGTGGASERLAAISGVYTTYTSSVGGEIVFSTNNGSGSFAERMRLSASGNLGLGVTPSAWSSSWKGFQVGSSTALYGRASGANITYLSNNVYINASGNDAYIASDYASTYRQYLGSHAWYTAPSGTAGNAITFTQAMTLDASGNLAIGGTTNKVTGVTGSGSGFTVQASGAPTLAIWDASDASYYTNITQINEVSYIWNIANGAMIFGTNNTERARITSGGDLLVGTTITGGVGITLYNAANNSNIGRIDFNKSYSGTATIQGFYYNGTGVGSIQCDNTNTNYATASDARLKENITDSASASDLIDAIQIRQFDWKSDGSHQRYGMVAQELLEVAPEAVSKPTDSDEMMGVDYSKLVPMLIKEVQSLRARVAQLETKG